MEEGRDKRELEGERGKRSEGEEGKRRGMETWKRDIQCKKKEERKGEERLKKGNGKGWGAQRDRYIMSRKKARSGRRGWKKKREKAEGHRETKGV
jgi:hypothetical protein